MYLLDDIITYIRRIIKTPNNDSITDSLLIDYINRFWINDVDARIQLFDLKTKYQFMTTPGVDQYNMPLYSLQIESPADDPQNISFYPVYQGVVGPCYINGVNVPLYTQKNLFFNIYPNILQNFPAIVQGDNGNDYDIQVPFLTSIPPPQNPPFNSLLRGHVDMSGVIASGGVDPPNASIESVPVTSVDARVFITALDVDGNNVLVTDSGQFLSTNVNMGKLIVPGQPPYGNVPVPGGYGTNFNVVDYLTGEINVTFPTNIPSGNNINVSCYFFQSGIPRAILFYNNTITLRSVPANQYLVEVDAYLSPAAYLQGADSIQFGYMSEYIARGAARKILSDTGDIEQFNFYEPLFLEQEILVWKRSQRQWTATRTPSFYSQGLSNGQFGNGSAGYL